MSLSISSIISLLAFVCVIAFGIAYSFPQVNTARKMAKALGLFAIIFCVYAVGLAILE